MCRERQFIVSFKFFGRPGKGTIEITFIGIDMPIRFGQLLKPGRYIGRIKRTVLAVIPFNLQRPSSLKGSPVAIRQHGNPLKGVLVHLPLGLQYVPNARYLFGRRILERLYGSLHDGGPLNGGIQHPG